jgi:signal transduction histidine kinase
MLSRRSEFHALYEHAPGFIATSEGPDHRFTFANAAYKRLVGRDNLVGLTAAEALPEIVDQGIIDLLDQVYRTGEPYVGEAVPMRILEPASGRLVEYTINFVYQPVRNADNVITGLFCEGFDVTEQHRAADALAALQAAIIHRSRVNVMGMMATTLAHELNQPLSVINNFTAGLLRLVAPDELADDRTVQALQGIQDASHRAAAIIRNLRDMTRRREPARALFDLRTAVAECARLVGATAEPTVRIANAIPDDVEIAADRVQIQQVVINLLRNACDAVTAADRKDITVSASRGEGGWIIGVADTGTGVSADAAENAFSWSISSKEDGMGFGLSICRMIVEAHGGLIWLNKSSAEGAEFCFSLPFGPNVTPAIRKAGLLIPSGSP